MKSQVRSLCVIAAAAALALLVASGRPARVEASSDYLNPELVRIGFRIAPVPLNLARKNPDLVGYGSYLVNAVADCNGCHVANPALEYADGGNPYFGQPKKVNPAVYLAGGQDFGQLIPGSYDVISRNLTPDKTGRAAGGHTYEEFRQIMRHGVDYDHLHPTCTGAPNANCIPPPFNGDLLQVMPWPSFQSMTDLDLHAIYEYLSSVPCIAGPPAPSVLHNDCSK